VKIDEDMLLSFENKANKKKKRKPSSKKSHNVTPHRLSKVFDLNKLQLILRRARWLPDKERYLSDPEILFRSNAFRPGKFLIRIRAYLLYSFYQSFVHYKKM
jgi:hypothetical protein